MMAFALLMSFDSEALAADSYAIFSLDSNFNELNITKARKLYRGKTKRLQGKRKYFLPLPSSLSISFSADFFLYSTTHWSYVT